MSDEPAIEVIDLSHRYGTIEALRGLTLDVRQGEIFALLGPNGSGKSTFFKVLSTLMPLQQGSIRVYSHDLASEPAAVRAALGVVFQSPSLDKKLRVEENLRCHARLYGLGEDILRDRIEKELERFGLRDRRRDFAETLSGGLQRRVELAQCLLHKPRILVLDEPSTGLDPAARIDLWKFLTSARDEGVTIVFTTHLLDEAERADRLAILHRGELAALDTPTALQESIGGDTITLRCEDPESLASAIRVQFEAESAIVDGALRLESTQAADLAPRLYDAFRDQIDELSLGKPTLEDVFIARTGHQFLATGQEGEV